MFLSQAPVAADSACQLAAHKNLEIEEGLLSSLPTHTPLHHLYHTAVAIILGGLVHSSYQRIHDHFDERKQRRRVLHARKLLSQSYQEWRSWALQIEKLDAEQAIAGWYKVRAHPCCNFAPSIQFNEGHVRKHACGHTHTHTHTHAR